MLPYWAPGARELLQVGAAAAAPAASFASLLGPEDSTAVAAAAAPVDPARPIAQLSNTPAGGAPAPVAVAAAAAPAMQPPAAPVGAPEASQAAAALAAGPARPAMSPAQPPGAPRGAPEASAYPAAAPAAAAGPEAGKPLLSLPVAAPAPAPGAAGGSRADIQDMLGAKAGAFTDATTLFLAGVRIVNGHFIQLSSLITLGAKSRRVCSAHVKFFFIMAPHYTAFASAWAGCATWPAAHLWRAREAALEQARVICNPK